MFIALIAGACSPKVRPVSTPVKPPVAKVDTPVKAPVKIPVKTSAISLLLPFGLDYFGPDSKPTPADAKKARLAIDYYQGFKLALDSLTWHGYNYKLMIYDTKNEAAQAHTLAYNPTVRASDLIVGPVFPEDVKVFTSILTSSRNPIVSPLSPAPPSVFKNQNLITVNPPLQYHAFKAAQYINDHIKPAKVFILKSGFSEENGYIIPFKKTIDSLGKKQIKVIMLTIVRGQLSPLLPQLSANEQNIFVIPSTNQPFLMVTLRSLDTLAKTYPVTVFGHPSWGKFAFLKTELMQRLNTYITSADKVNYKSAATIAFIRNYRKAYHVEPTSYAIKGFDEGLYFGQLLAANRFNHPEQNDFEGLHNKFHFLKKTGEGWINTSVQLLRYTNFELKPVE